MAPPAGEPRANAGPPVAPDGSPTVLVCDDDPEVRGFVADALSAEGFVIETAERAVDAVQRIMRARYCALLLDLKLPGLGGLDAIGVVKRLDESLPIVVMTGHGSYETEQAARAAGIFYYLVKPFGVSELVDAVRAAARFRETGRGRS